MAERKKIALIFKNDPNWMGGTYYVLNIINALDTLPDKEKPEILLLVRNDDDFTFAQTNTSYPYLSKRTIFNKKNNILKKGINRIYKFITKNNFPLFIPKFIEKVDAIYPLIRPGQIRSKSRKIYWIPDLQHKYLPQYFSNRELKNRDNIIKNIIQENSTIVFSSQDALDSFKLFFPEGKESNTAVFHFTTAIPKVKTEKTKEVLGKYGLTNDFFYCSNQFWIHKNHKVLFEAIKILKDQGTQVTLACSGGTKDYRNPTYFKELLDYIDNNNLKENIKILGFIDREDQLILLNECKALIQPSLFEGWNTSIEEAKALNKFIIASDLEVHKEQVQENFLLFNRKSGEDLAKKIKEFANDRIKLFMTDYNKNIKTTGISFNQILTN